MFKKFNDRLYEFTLRSICFDYKDDYDLAYKMAQAKCGEHFDGDYFSEIWNEEMELIHEAEEMDSYQD